MAGPVSPSFDLSGGCLALDFANTWEDRGRCETDKLVAYDDVVAFAGQAGLLEPAQTRVLGDEARRRPAAAKKALLACRDLREALYRIFSGQAAHAEAEATDLVRLSAAVARGARLLRLEPGGGGFTWRWHGLDSSLEAVLAPIARSAAELLTGDDLTRVRECDGNDCTWLFLDTSRNRSRRWCSMESCGNRAKVRRHYHRRRAAREPA